ncbi:MAG: hypothetical protein QM598_13060 [Protaetiibacter sp.]
MTDLPLASDRPARDHRPLFALTAAVVAIALGAGGYLATAAAFTDSQTVEGSTVRTATLRIGSPLKTKMNTAGLLPGATQNQTVMSFVNDGTVDFAYSVALTNIATDASTQSIADKLRGWVTVTLTSNGEHATGTLDAPPVLQAGTLATGGDARVDVTIGLSTDADNDVQDKAVLFDVVVSARQVS